MKGTRKLRQDDNLIFNISKQELTTTPVKLFEASNNEWQRICERASILGQSSMMIENSHAHANEVHHFFLSKHWLIKNKTNWNFAFIFTNQNYGHELKQKIVLRKSMISFEKTVPWCYFFCDLNSQIPILNTFMGFQFVIQNFSRS